MKKEILIWIGVFTFVLGQIIQLITCSMAHYLYVSDPVMMCVTVGIVTSALVVLTVLFTLMAPKMEEPMRWEAYEELSVSDETSTQEPVKAQEPSDIRDVIPQVFRDWRKNPITEEAATELFKEYEKNTPEVEMKEY